MFVKFFFFGFGCDADLALDFRIADRNEMPRLQICPARSAPCDAQTTLDDLARDRSLGEIAHGASLSHVTLKMLNAFP